MLSLACLFERISDSGIRSALGAAGLVMAVQTLETDIPGTDLLCKSEDDMLWKYQLNFFKTNSSEYLARIASDLPD